MYGGERFFRIRLAIRLAVRNLRRRGSNILVVRVFQMAKRIVNIHQEFFITRRTLRDKLKFLAGRDVVHTDFSS